ncbi:MULTISPECIES: N-acetylglutaminylglutamine amidotransferase [Pseudomonas]|uniref:asparagine synthase (glutamine-hydrolyzing) n=1 Tax=Pseudomonas oryzihabitans TaxID=47885 RepID=A0A178LKI9_9PSED|nr:MULTISPECIES: N-acetylglutaminylglutamine amidotransferase [Pseudomonas]NRH40597.1 N-acetylglutaminylglutamine amidotransferase [Pseudomonas sp. MS15a(2019)]OAN31389.1 asparagine synthetase B [Pseudomonas oryzihabitans]
MCGIAGELRFDQQPAAISAVERITHRLEQRGPDAWGFHSQGPVALGHRRLKIMDLAEASGQPMIEPELGLSMVFNGAIYNYPELRSELEAKGYSFYSGGDTEILLKAYHAWGKDMLPKLNGMFAFAIWERDSGRLFIARDRLGIKPLYLSFTDKRLRFASSLPALLEAGDIDTRIDPVALNHYLNFHAVVPAPRTILQGVQKLPPATWMTVDASGQQHQETWWNLDYGPREDERRYTLDDWAERVLHGLKDAVAIRQRAAREVGVLLSGGVDSSLLVGLLHDSGVKDLLTFSIGFEDAGGERGDEFQYSDLIANHYGTRHHQLRIAEDEIIQQLPRAFSAMSEPMVSHDCIAFYLLSREVSKHCKVVQSGQGADELFAGYHWYPQVHGAADPFAAYRAAFFDRDYAQYAATVQAGMRLEEDAAEAFVRQHFAKPGASAGVDKALRLDSTVMLVDDPVKRVDNMTMAWGLEARVPFLDYRLAELSARIPAEFKLGDGGKQVLKAAARKVIPQEVIDRPKGYFPVPGLKHLEGNTLSWVRELLLDPSQDRGLFDTAEIDRLLTNPADRITPLRGSKLWQLAALNLWLSEHGL